MPGRRSLGALDEDGLAVLRDKYPSPATCSWHLKQRKRQDVGLDALPTLPGFLDGQGLLHWGEAFLEGSVAPAKRAVAKTKCGK